MYRGQAIQSTMVIHQEEPTTEASEEPTTEASEEPTTEVSEELTKVEPEKPTIVQHEAVNDKPQTGDDSPIIPFRRSYL